ncbi:MAG: nucleotidyltransferase family protein [Myxococcaceae bacterium]|nr:nucleotidyltransferase family protein [Myxococcaceae bacterium]
MGTLSRLSQLMADRLAPPTVERVVQALRGELDISSLRDAERATLVHTAQAHGVAGLLAHTHPDFARPTLGLKAQFMRAFISSTAAVAALEKAGIRCVVMKGITASSHWADTQVRPQSDLDLLVAPADMPRAKAALLEGGIAKHVSIEGHFVHNASLKPASPAGLYIELHYALTSHHLLNVDIAALVAQREMIAMNGVTVPSLHPADAVVYLALHASTHALARLAWLVDLDGYARRSTVDWLDAARRAVAWGCPLAVGLAWDEARRLLCAPIPDAAMEGLERPRAQSRLVQALYWATTRTTGSAHRTAERTFRLSLVPPRHLPGVIVKKLRANHEQDHPV